MKESAYECNNNLYIPYSYNTVNYTVLFICILTPLTLNLFQSENDTKINPLVVIVTVCVVIGLIILGKSQTVLKCNYVK